MCAVFVSLQCKDLFPQQIVGCKGIYYNNIKEKIWHLYHSIFFRLPILSVFASTKSIMGIYVGNVEWNRTGGHQEDGFSRKRCLASLYVVRITRYGRQAAAPSTEKQRKDLCQKTHRTHLPARPVYSLTLCVSRQTMFLTNLKQLKT